MAIENINVGAAPNDNTGDKLRAAFVKVNSNFSDLDTRTTAAQTAADGAQGAASAAQTAADDALTAANAAQAAASAAQSTADNAVSDAAAASSAAAAASSAAAAASSAAATADGKAVAAQGTANDALSAANQALSTAYLRRGALPADTTHDLNDWGLSQAGLWFQRSSVYANTSQNYPAGIAGVLEVMPWNDASGGRIVQRYTVYNTGVVYVRGQNNVGAWSLWIRQDTEAARNAALGALAVGFETELLNYALKANLEWLSKPIGEPFPLWDHMPGLPIPPTDNPDFRFIKLTAGDAYNDGVLTAESVTGTAPLVQATAQISLAGSPVDGATVHLINTERSGLRAGDSGVFQQDALQNITGYYNGPALRRLSDESGGAFLVSNTSISQGPTGSTGNGLRLEFNASLVARTANETRMKNVGATYYMRIM